MPIPKPLPLQGNFPGGLETRQGELPLGFNDCIVSELRSQREAPCYSLDLPVSNHMGADGGQITGPSVKTEKEQARSGKAMCDLLSRSWSSCLDVSQILKRHKRCSKVRDAPFTCADILLSCCLSCTIKMFRPFWARQPEPGESRTSGAHLGSARDLGEGPVPSQCRSCTEKGSPTTCRLLVLAVAFSVHSTS